MGGGDVLQIDAAESRRDGGHGFDELFGRSHIHLDIEYVDAGEFFEQHALALHHRFARQGTFPRPSTALPSVMTATRLPFEV